MSLVKKSKIINSFVFLLIFYCINSFSQPSYENRHFEVENTDGTIAHYTNLNDLSEQERPCLEEQLNLCLQWLSLPENKNIQVSTLVLRLSKSRDSSGIIFDKTSKQLKVHVLLLKNGQCIVKGFDNFNAALKAKDSSVEDKALPKVHN